MEISFNGISFSLFVAQFIKKQNRWGALEYFCVTQFHVAIKVEITCSLTFYRLTTRIDRNFWFTDSTSNESGSKWSPSQVIMSKYSSRSGFVMISSNPVYPWVPPQSSGGHAHSPVRQLGYRLWGSHSKLHQQLLISKSSGYCMVTTTLYLITLVRPKLLYSSWSELIKRMQRSENPGDCALVIWASYRELLKLSK